MFVTLGIDKMKKLIKKIPFLYAIAKKVRMLQNYIRLKNKKYIFKTQLKNKKPIKIVIGASGKFESGWIPTEQSFLNLLKYEDWEKYFLINSIDSIMSEHVWEHLTQEEGLLAAQNCYKYLKDGGTIRIAVPDGYHPDKSYIEKVDVGADDHKILYTHKSLASIFKEAGFEVTLLEYFDEDGVFHYKEWDYNNGRIYRSSNLDERNKVNKLSYTSIILDAQKYE